MKKIGILLTASALSIGMFSSAVSATSPAEGQPVKVVAKADASEKIVSKEELIKKFRSTFPGLFDFVKASEFHMSSHEYYPYPPGSEDEQKRYNLSFHKRVNGKEIYGSVGFYGENLDIESFHYQPPNSSDALFPAKVSKDEAKQTATDFVKKNLKNGQYKLSNEQQDYYYYSKQILTEPIRYSFTFNRLKEGVPIADQSVNITVLGSGEIVSYYGSQPTKSPTYDDVKKVKNQKEIVEKVKENLTTRLQYQVNSNYETGKTDVKLVYVPEILNMNALTGEWFNGKEFLAQKPAAKKVEKIVETALPAKQDGITKEEAKKTAEKLLQVKSDKVKLSIQSVEEMKNYNGIDVISVHYMYNYANGGVGASLEFDKKTGELLQYHNSQSSFLRELGELKANPNPISKDQAIAEAVKFLKEYMPSYLHEYALPIEESYYDETFGSYHLTFPRVINGVPVMGDQINVGIDSDGTLNSLYVSRQKIEKWPAVDKILSADKAKEELVKALSVELSYAKKNYKKETKHYHLMYAPLFNEKAFNVLDATSGKWINHYNIEETPEISHPTAAEELNYLIRAKVLTIKDPAKFNADAAVSKGEAIKIMMNSLTYIYDYGYPETEEKKQSFTNIDPKHPSYGAIERAVEAGILKTDKPTFDANSPVTKEDLAVWYVRALGLDVAAKQKNIFKNEFADSKKIKPEYTGHVILAHSLGLVKAEKNQFNPTKEVTYADLAVSSIRLAHEIANKRSDFRFY